MTDNTEDIYSRVIAVTDRHLCGRPFLEQIELICSRRPRAVLLREKDLTEEEYGRLLTQVREVCDVHHVFCIPHTFAGVASEQRASAIHLPLPVLREHRHIAGQFRYMGASVHSVPEAVEAERLGASYVTAGHIFATACKPGAVPRGVGFLREVCAAVDIPVYAIGGMQGNLACIEKMRAAGAAGICVMSECMRWPDRLPLVT